MELESSNSGCETDEDESENTLLYRQSKRQKSRKVCSQELESAGSDREEADQ